MTPSPISVARKSNIKPSELRSSGKRSTDRKRAVDAKKQKSPEKHQRRRDEVPDDNALNFSGLRRSSRNAGESCSELLKPTLTRRPLRPLRNATNSNQPMKAAPAPSLTSKRSHVTVSTATSTPSLSSLRSLHKQKTKQLLTESLLSPPKVSPVQKVDSPTVNGNLITSPDNSGSPSFRCTRSSAKLHKDATTQVLTKKQSPLVLGEFEHVKHT